MRKPKPNTTRAARRIPATLRKRAQAIINSDAYDDDTRESIKYELRTNYDGLADMVGRAEQGETICDTFKDAAERRNAARRVIALIETPGVPDFLADAMVDALARAAATKEIELWKRDGDAEAYDAKAMAQLFLLAPRFLPSPTRVSGKQCVADAVVEILQNPQTPADLYEHVAEWVAEAISREKNELLHGALVITALLASFPENESRAAVIDARRADDAATAVESVN